MTQNKTDLRIIKTKASIKREFMTLLQKKPVEKITVTELAEKALINKGTFYLHYQDIYNLYEEVIHDVIADFCDNIDFYEDFFSAPKDFASKIMLRLSTGPLEQILPHMNPLSTKIPVPILLTEELKSHLYSLGILSPSVKNDIKLEYTLLSLFMISFRHGQERFDEASETIAQAINSFFGSSLTKE